MLGLSHDCINHKGLCFNYGLLFLQGHGVRRLLFLIVRRWVFRAKTLKSYVQSEVVPERRLKLRLRCDGGEVGDARTALGPSNLCRLREDVLE